MRAYETTDKETQKALEQGFQSQFSQHPKVYKSINRLQVPGLQLVFFSF